MTKPLRTHIASEPPAPFREVFESLADPSWSLSFGDEESADTQILVQGVPSEDDLKERPDLQALVIPYAGVPTPTRERVLEIMPNLKVYNLHHNAAPTAETAISLMMAAAKRTVANHNALAQGDWRPRYAESRSVLLEGRRMLLLGYGAIGKRIAIIAEAIGMKVRILRNSPEAADLRQASISKLDQELPAADVLMIACPLTEATKGLIGERELALMPRESIVVNIGRGLIVDEEALYDALSKGGIGAAGLDVWYSYPRSEEARADTLPSAFPFGELGNVAMSPHCGGHSDQTERLRATALAELLRQIANDSATPVGLQRGY